MQPSWIPVPWFQFQSLGNPAAGLNPAGQLMASPQSHYPALNGLNPLSSAALTTSSPSIFTSVAGYNNPVSITGLSGPTAMLNSAGLPSTINSINGSLTSINGGMNGLHLPPCIPGLHPNGVAGLSLPGLGALNGSMGGLGAMMALPPGHANGNPLAPGALLPLRHRQPGPLPTIMQMKGDDLSSLPFKREKRKAEEEFIDHQEIKKAKLETKALKAKRPGFSEERYNETSYFIENGLRKVYPYYFTFTTFTKGRWVGEKILDVFAKEFRAHPPEEYERCIKSGTLTVNYERVDIDCRLKHNDLLANIVHRHEVPVTAARIPLIYTDEETVVVDKPASIPVHPCGRYRHNTVVFILAKEYNLKNLRTIHRLDRLTSGLLLFGRTPKKARDMEQQIRTRQVGKQYVCRVEGRFPSGLVICTEPIEVVSYKIGVCKVSPSGKDCKTEFQLLSFNGNSSVVLCKPRTGRMHQIRVHLQYLGYPIVNDPLYNHIVFGPNKGKGGISCKTDEQLIADLIKIHNAENWLGMDGDVEYSMFKGRAKEEGDDEGETIRSTPSPKDKLSTPSTPADRAPSIASNSSETSLSDELLKNCSASSNLLIPNGQNSGSPDTSAIDVNRPTPEDHNSNNLTGDYSFKPHLITMDKNCYECKVKYRDPKPKDLVMFLHALKYSGPGWHFETKMPEWANPDWQAPEEG